MLHKPLTNCGTNRNNIDTFGQFSTANLPHDDNWFLHGRGVGGVGACPACKTLGPGLSFGLPSGLCGFMISELSAEPRIVFSS